MIAVINETSLKISILVVYVLKMTWTMYGNVNNSKKTLEKHNVLISKAVGIEASKIKYDYIF